MGDKMIAFATHVVLMPAMQAFLIYAAAASFMSSLVFIWQRNGFKVRKIRAQSPQTKQILREVANSARSVFVYAASGALLFALFRFSGVKIGDHFLMHFSTLRLIWSIPAIILIHDLYFYVIHRMMHHPLLFSTFHREHHRSHNPSPWAAYSFSLPEAVIQGVYVPLYALLIPVPFVTPFVFMFFQIALNVMGHCGFEIYPSWMVTNRYTGWMTGVTHHDIHHATSTSNYAVYFRIWDRVFGTEHPNFVRLYDHAKSASNRQDGYQKYLSSPKGTQRVDQDDEVVASPALR
jgi:sterol desaturase/sphingolipid hydroxylase (fatty acid hydroxylase superfamily)